MKLHPATKMAFMQPEKQLNALIRWLLLFMIGNLQQILGFVGCSGYFISCPDFSSPSNSNQVGWEAICWSYWILAFIAHNWQDHHRWCELCVHHCSYLCRVHAEPHVIPLVHRDPFKKLDIFDPLYPLNMECLFIFFVRLKFAILVISIQLKEKWEYSNLVHAM